MLQRQRRIFIGLGLIISFIFFGIEGFMFKDTLVQRGMQLYDLLKVGSKENVLYWVLATSVLPLIGIPSSALCILSSLLYGPWMGFVLTYIGFCINIILAYVLSAFVFRVWIQKLLSYLGYKPLKKLPSNELFWIIGIRAIPTIPMGIQSYLLGLAKVSFRWYFIISLIAEAIYIGAIIFSAGYLFSGRWIVGLSSAIIFCILIFAIKHWGRRHGFNKDRFSTGAK